MTDAGLQSGVTRLTEDGRGNTSSSVSIFLWSNLEISNVDLRIFAETIIGPSHGTARQYLLHTVTKADSDLSLL